MQESLRSNPKMMIALILFVFFIFSFIILRSKTSSSPPDSVAWLVTHCFTIVEAWVQTPLLLMVQVFLIPTSTKCPKCHHSVWKPQWYMWLNSCSVKRVCKQRHKFESLNCLYFISYKKKLSIKSLQKHQLSHQTSWLRPGWEIPAKNY